MVQRMANQRVASAPPISARRSGSGVRTSSAFAALTQSPQQASGVVKRSAMNNSQTASAPNPMNQASQGNSAANDFRQLFGGVAGVVPPPDPTPATPPFVPSFRSAVGTDGTQQWNLNHDYFATKDTAQWIANKYGNGQVFETQFEGSGGPFSASATEYQIKLPDGRMVNAGILAGYYERNPESQFPGLADKLIRNQLAQA